MTGFILCLSAVVVLGLAVGVAEVASMRRKLARVGRLEAKIDRLMAHFGVEYDPGEGLPDGVAEALARGDSIAAIGAFRLATGASLREAKARIDRAAAG